MKSFIKYLIPALLFVLGFNFRSAKVKSTDEDVIVIENVKFRLIIGNDARAVSLLHKPNGQECLQKEIRRPVFAMTQYCPYDNEIFLTYPELSGKQLCFRNKGF